MDDVAPACAGGAWRSAGARAWRGAVAGVGKPRGLAGEKGAGWRAAVFALFQQAPLQQAGQIFDPRNIRAVDIVPAGVAVRAWDLAATDAPGRDPDWTVGLKLLRSEGGAVLH